MTDLEVIEPPKEFEKTDNQRLCEMIDAYIPPLGGIAKTNHSQCYQDVLWLLSKKDEAELHHLAKLREVNEIEEKYFDKMRELTTRLDECIDTKNLKGVSELNDTLKANLENRGVIFLRTTILTPKKKWWKFWNR